MKKTTYLLIALYAISIIYALVQYFLLGEALILSFLNSVGVFSIILFIIMILLILSGFGYFDVFGYTFKKTYFMFTNKYNKMNIENQEKYRSYYDYTQFKEENRLHLRPSFLLYIFGFILINLILSILYVYIIG